MDGFITSVMSSAFLFFGVEFAFSSSVGVESFDLISVGSVTSDRSYCQSLVNQNLVFKLSLWIGPLGVFEWWVFVDSG